MLGIRFSIEDVVERVDRSGHEAECESGRQRMCRRSRAEQLIREEQACKDGSVLDPLPDPDERRVGCQASALREPALRDGRRDFFLKRHGISVNSGAAYRGNGRSFGRRTP